MAVADGAGRQADPVFAQHGLVATIDPGLDGGQIAFDGSQQGFALAYPFAGEIGISAHEQPVAGKSGEVMPAMSPSSNRESCKAPPSTSDRIAGARKAVIQPSPAGLNPIRYEPG